MTDVNTEQRSIYDTLMAMVAVGDDAAAREYLMKHIDLLPPQLQKEVAFAMFVEGVQDEAAMREFVVELQKQGLAAAEALQKSDDTSEESAAG